MFIAGCYFTTLAHRRLPFLKIKNGKKKLKGDYKSDTVANTVQVKTYSSTIKEEIPLCRCIRQILGISHDSTALLKTLHLCCILSLVGIQFQRFAALKRRLQSLPALLVTLIWMQISRTEV